MTKEELSQVLERTYTKMFDSIEYSRDLIGSQDYTIEEYTALSIQAAWEGQEEYRKAFKEKNES